MAARKRKASASGARRPKGRRRAGSVSRAAEPKGTTDADRELDAVLSVLAKPMTRHEQTREIALAVGVDRARAETMRERGIVVLQQRRQGTSDAALEQLERLRTISAAAFAKKKYGDAVRAEELWGKISGTIDPEANKPPAKSEPVEVKITVVGRTSTVPPVT